MALQCGNDLLELCSEMAYGGSDNEDFLKENEDEEALWKFVIVRSYLAKSNSCFVSLHSRM